MKITTSLLSSIGGRDKNDDYADFTYKEDSYGIWVVADGLGGHMNGNVASKLAVESILKSYESNSTLAKDNIENIIKNANMDIINAQGKHILSNGMRTTVVGLFTDSEKVLWAHVGDSRLYYFKQGELSSQTKDHSVSQMAVSAGEISPDEIRFHEDRNKLLRVLGSEPELRVEVLKEPVELKTGDAFLLCTDGFWELVYETEMEIDLCKANSPEEWIRYMVERLYKRASEGNDNFSAAALFVE